MATLKTVVAFLARVAVLTFLMIGFGPDATVAIATTYLIAWVLGYAEATVDSQLR